MAIAGGLTVSSDRILHANFLRKGFAELLGSGGDRVAKAGPGLGGATSSLGHGASD